MATKKFPHAVIYNGTLYAANTEIVVKDAEEKDAAKKAVTKNEKGTGRKA